MTKIFLAELSFIELYFIIFANFSYLLESVQIAVANSDIFSEEQFQQVV